jgi:hypothetical protein
VEFQRLTTIFDSDTRQHDAGLKRAEKANRDYAQGANAATTAATRQARALGEVAKTLLGLIPGGERANDVIALLVESYQRFARVADGSGAAARKSGEGLRAAGAEAEAAKAKFTGLTQVVELFAKKVVEAQKIGNVKSLFKGLDAETGKRAGSQIGAQIASQDAQQGFQTFLSAFGRLKTEQQQAAAATRLFGNEAKDLLPALRAAGGDAGKLAASLAPAAAGLETTAAGASGAGAALGAMGGPIGIAIAAAAALVVAEGVVIKTSYDLAAAAAEVINKQADFAAQSGLSIENMSALSVAAHKYNVDLKQVNDGLIQFANKAREAIGQGQKQQKEFAQFGVTAEEVLSNFDGSLEKVFRRLAEFPNGTQRATAAAKLFGEEGGRYISLLVERSGGDFRRFRQEAEALGLILGDANVRQARAFQDATRQLSAEWESFKLRVGAGVLPFIVAGLQSVKNTINELPGVTTFVTGALQGFLVTAILVPLLQIEAALTRVSRLLRDLRGIPAQGESSASRGFLNFANEAIKATKRKAGVFDDVDPALRGAGGGGRAPRAGGGESALQRAARQALQLAEVDLQRAQRLFAEKNTRYQQLYDAGLADLYRYIVLRQKATRDLFAQEQTTFAKERDLIEKSKLEKGEKAVRLAQLGEKEAAAKARADQEVLRLQLEYDERKYEATRRYAQGTIQLHEAMYRALALLNREAIEKGKKTNEEALNELFAEQQAILQGRLALLQADLGRLTINRTSGKPIPDNEQDAARVKEVKQKIEILNKEIEAEEIRHTGELRRARLADLKDAQDYSDALERITQETGDVVFGVRQRDIENERRQLSRRDELINIITGGNLRLINLEKDLALERELIRHESAVRQLEAQRARIQAEVANEQRRTELLQAIDGRIQAETLQAAQNVADIEAEANEKRLQQIETLGDRIQGQLSRIADNWRRGGFRAALAGMLEDFANFLQQLVFKALAAKVAEAILGRLGTGDNSGGGGGGFFSRLFGIVIGALAGGFGGGGRTTGANVISGSPRGLGGAAATGGLITGPGHDTSDNLLARLSPGEFVVRARAVRAIGLTALEQINRFGRLPALADGGLASFGERGPDVAYFPSPGYVFNADEPRGPVRGPRGDTTSNSTQVNNYTINLPPPRTGSYERPASRREAAETALAFLRGRGRR